MFRPVLADNSWVDSLWSHFLMEQNVMKHLSLAVIGLIFLGTGCATVRGDKQKMKIETDPPGASLKVDDQSYTTPAEVTLVRKANHKIAVAKEGYRPIVFNFEATWDGASMTDLAVPGGSALMGMSAVTGSDKQFNQLAKIKLEKTSDPKPATLELFQFRGKLLTKADYDKAVEAEQKDPTRFGGNE